MPAAKKKAPGNLVAIVGSDEGEIKRVAGERAAAMAPPDAGEFGIEVIDGAVDTVDAAVQRIHQTLDALLTMPFFGGEKLVWLKSAAFFSDTVAGRSETVVEAVDRLKETLEKGLPDGIRFLISAIDIDKRRGFYKALGKLADVEVYDALDTSKGGWEEAAGELVSQRASECGLRFTEDAHEIFVQFTGGDKHQIGTELEKLSLYLGKDATATETHVRMLVPMSRQGVVFELGNLLAKRDVHGCFAMLDQLLQQGETPIGILLVAVIPTVRNLLITKDLMERERLRPPAKPWFFGGTLEKLRPESTAHLPRKKDGGINAYSLGIAAVSAHRFETRELRELLDACLEANIKMVSSALDPKVILATLIARVAPKERRAA